MGTYSGRLTVKITARSDIEAEALFNNIVANGLAGSLGIVIIEQDIKLEDEDAGYELNDPKHPEYHSTHADIWDMREGK